MYNCVILRMCAADLLSSRFTRGVILCLRPFVKRKCISFASTTLCSGLVERSAILGHS